MIYTVRWQIETTCNCTAEIEASSPEEALSIWKNKDYGEVERDEFEQRIIEDSEEIV